MFDQFPGVLTMSQSSTRLSPYLPVWKSITSDKWVLAIIAHGYSFEFEEEFPSPHFIHTPHSDHLAIEASSLLQKDAIRGRSDASSDMAAK